MSTSICKTFVVTGALLLGACNNLPALNAGPPVESKTLASGIEVAGPSGYCVDPSSSHWVGRAVTLFSCARLKDPKASDPTEARILSASSVEGGLTDRGDFANFLKSDAGRTLLSRTDSFETVTVHKVRTSRRAVYVEFTDTATPEHLGQRSWKAFVPTQGHTAVLSVYRGKGDSVSGSVGESLIRDFAAEILRINQASA